MESCFFFFNDQEGAQSLGIWRSGWLGQAPGDAAFAVAPQGGGGGWGGTRPHLCLQRPPNSGTMLGWRQKRVFSTHSSKTKAVFEATSSEAKEVLFTPHRVSSYHTVTHVRSHVSNQRGLGDPRIAPSF